MKKRSTGFVLFLGVVFLASCATGCGKEEKKTAAKKKEEWYTKGTKEVKPGLDKLH